MPLDPALQAAVDQMGASVRDLFDALEVDTNDPETVRIIRIVWTLIAKTYQNDPEYGVTFALAGIDAATNHMPDA